MTDECRQLEPLLTPWIDGLLPAPERGAVDEHLRRCAECREAARRQGLMRQMLQTNATALREAAPASLQQRLRPKPAPVAGPRAWTRTPVRPRWSIPVAAALLLGLLAVGAVAVLEPTGVLLAAELALDHLKCRLLAVDESGTAPVELESRWQASHDWALDVPPGNPHAGLELTGLRHCLFHGGSLAHVLYRYKGRVVSLFVMPETRQTRPSLEIMGVQAVSWSSDGRTFGLVGDAGRDELDRLARYLRGDGQLQ